MTNGVKKEEIKKEKELKFFSVLTSFPNGNPVPNVAVSPIIFAISVLKVKYSFRTTPLKIVFISGIPEPKISKYL